jgi:xanthine dehydrogenase accessory factor
MKDVLPDIDRWLGEGESVAVATVVETWGSAPRPPGARMALTAGGKIAGSVSAGCVENAVVEAGQQTLKSGRPRLLRFGVADDTAWSVGLACGGTIEVFVEKLEPSLWQLVRDEVLAERPVAAATVVRGPDPLLGRRRVLLHDGNVRGAIGEGLDEAAAAEARAALATGASRRVAIGTEPGVELFVEVLRPAPRLIIVGGVHIALSLAALARRLGYRTVIVDPRQAFANRQRFPDVDRIVNTWPDRALAELSVDDSTAIVILTHDPKLDDPALAVSLASPAFYVGALGSRRTQQKRRERLLAAGLPEKGLARLRAPIGLDLGGRSPEEIALAVLAEIVAIRNGVANPRAPAKSESRA